MSIAQTLRATAAFPARKFKTLARLAAAPLRMSIMITLIVNVVAFLGFQYPIFIGFQGLVDLALNATLLIVFLVWCSYAAAAIRIACGEQAGIDRFRLKRPEIEFAVAAVVIHGAIAALITIPVIFILTIIDGIWGTALGDGPGIYFAIAAVIFAGIAVRIATALSVVARGAVVNPTQVLRDIPRGLLSLTMAGVVVFAVLGLLFFAATTWWQVTTPTWRQITRIAAPFLLQLALVIYGAFLAGLLGALHRSSKTF